MSTTYTPNAGLGKPARADRNWDVQLNANCDVLDACAAIGGLAVTPTEFPSASLNVKAAAGQFRKSNGTLAAFAGTSSQAIAANTTTYLWLTEAGVLALGTAFPSATNIVMLAAVTAGASTITTVSDQRTPWFSFGMPTMETGTGTVTSVGLSLPSDWTVTNSPVTTTGVLTAIRANQNANVFLAGPASGGPAAPSYRALVGADLPVFAASGTAHASGAVPDPGGTAGTTRFLREDATWAAPPSGGSSGVTSVGLSMPLQFTVSGAPVTSTGTFAVGWNNQAANQVLAGPPSGTAAAPAYRALVGADLPVFGPAGASHAPGAVPDPGAGSSGATALVQNTGTFDNGSANTNPLSITLGSATTTGHLLAVIVAGKAASGSTAPTFTVSDTSGGTWTQAAYEALNTSGGYSVAIWYLANITGESSHSVSVTPSIASYLSIGVYEISGAATASPLGATAVNNGSGTNPAAIGASCAAGSFLLAGTANDSSSGMTISSGSSWISGYADTTMAGILMAGEYHANIAAGTITPSFTQSSSADWAIVMAEFKAATGSTLAFLGNDAAWHTVAAGVSSVFGRTGSVTASSGDYTVGQITGAAPLASPAFTGTPTAPTAANGTNTTQVATTAFVLANNGAGTAIGGAVSGGTAGRVLFEGAGPVLADSANLTYSGGVFAANGFQVAANGTVTTNNPPATPVFGGPGSIFAYSPTGASLMGVVISSSFFGGHTLGYTTSPQKWLIGLSSNATDTTALSYFEDSVAAEARMVLFTGGNVAFGTISGASRSSQVSIENDAAGDNALVVKGAASQTANLQQWENSSGTVLASVSATGVFSGSGAGLTGVPTSNTWPVTTPSSYPYTCLSTDLLVLVDTSAARTITLPSGSSAGIGRIYALKDATGSAATNNITVAVSGGGTIDGATQAVIVNNLGEAEFISDGTKWRRKSNRPDLIDGNLTVNRKLLVGGSMNPSVCSFTTQTFTLNPNLSINLVNYTGSGGVTATLPTAASVGTNLLLVVKDMAGTAGTNHITIQAGGTDKIDGAASLTITANYSAVRLICDGSSNWYSW